MKISSWNVNSVRARINSVIKYLKSSSPDILLIQEIKTEEKNFPINDFKSLGYNSHVFGQKSYNGVAFLTKINIGKIDLKFIKDKKKQSRVIVGNIKNKSKIIKLINVYVPNGNPVDTEKYIYKNDWYNSFNNKVKKELKGNKNIIIGGDFNIIPEEIDVYDHTKYENDALFKLEMRKKYRELLNLGLHDIYRHINKEKQEFSFWDYMSGAWAKNHGMRIDHFLVSNNLLSDVKSININKKPRSDIKPSDHTPIELLI